MQFVLLSIKLFKLSVIYLVWQLHQLKYFVIPNKTKNPAWPAALHSLSSPNQCSLLSKYKVRMKRAGVSLKISGYMKRTWLSSSKLVHKVCLGVTSLQPYNYLEIH